LYDELPGLIQAGVLTGDAADRLRGHYGEAPKASGRRIALTIFSILASVLIGAGIIMLLAYNWQGLGRPVRTVLALLPLVAAQALACWIVASGRTGAAWREGVGTFMSFAVAASIALVSQTYHIAGSTDTFLLVWMLLTLPIVYLLKATAPCLVYFAGITALAGFVQAQGGHGLLFWVLFLGAVPHVWLVAREGRYSARSAVLGWGVAICLCAATGITLEKVMPGLWIVVYSALFEIFYLAGSYWFRDAPSDWQKPYHIVGAAGIAVLCLMFTYEWPWEDVGWRFYRYSYRFHQNVAWFDYAAAVLLPVSAVGLLVTAVRRREATRILYGVMPILAAAGFCITALKTGEAVPMLLFNLYMLVLGVGTIVFGIRDGRLAVVNGGMVVLSALIVARFFDEDLGLVVRGVAFILIGVGFLVANLVLAKKLKGGAQ